MPDLLQTLPAFGLGALHALEPGHGKGVMGAYLAVSRGKPLHAIILGLASALSHTLVILLLAVGAHAAAATLQSSSLETGGLLKTWLHLAVGLLLIFIGWRLGRQGSHAAGSCNHTHPVPARTPQLVDLLLLGLTNGLLPCPGALAVLLLSLQAGDIAAGLAAIFAFGAGAAAALIAAGIVLVKATSLAGNMLGARAWSRLATAAGVVVASLGVYTALRAGYALWTG